MSYHFNVCVSFYAFDRVYNHIKPASQVPPGCDYMLFKVSVWSHMHSIPHEFICVYDNVEYISELHNMTLAHQ